MPDTIGAAFADEIERYNAQLVQWLSDVDERSCYVRPGPDDWTVMENLVHIVEMQPYWAGEVLSVLNQPGSPFGRTIEDPDRIGYVAAHAGDNVGDVAARLKSSAGGTGRGVRSIPHAAWETIGVHSRRGPMTLRQIVEFFLTNHLSEHIDQTKRTYQTVRHPIASPPSGESATE